MKHHNSVTHRQPGKLLTESISDFSRVSFPKHESIQVNEIIATVRRFLATIPSGGVGLISLAGYPGAGKTSHTHLIVRAVEEVLGLMEKDILFVVKNPKHEVIEVGGRVCMMTGNSRAKMSTDNFFGTIGPGRRGEMLQSQELFSKLFGNLEAFIEVMTSILSGKSTDIKVYLGTDEERSQRKALGSIEFRAPHIPHGGKRIIVVEGVNANEWVTHLERDSSVLGNNVSLHILKILFNISPVTSNIRVLRRDFERKGYSFYDILKLRLSEAYFITKQYMEPALLDPSVILLDKRRDIPLFTGVDIQLILQSLEELHKLFSEDNSLTHEHKAFISTLIQHDEETMKGLKGVSEIELEVWRQEKKLKGAESVLANIKSEYDKQADVVKMLRDQIHKMRRGIPK